MCKVGNNYPNTIETKSKKHQSVANQKKRLIACPTNDVTGVYMFGDDGKSGEGQAARSSALRMNAFDSNFEVARLHWKNHVEDIRPNLHLRRKTLAAYLKSPFHCRVSVVINQSRINFSHRWTGSIEARELHAVIDKFNSFLRGRRRIEHRPVAVSNDQRIGLSRFAGISVHSHHS